MVWDWYKRWSFRVDWISSCDIYQSGSDPIVQPHWYGWGWDGEMIQMAHISVESIVFSAVITRFHAFSWGELKKYSKWPRDQCWINTYCIYMYTLHQKSEGFSVILDREYSPCTWSKERIDRKLENEYWTHNLTLEMNVYCNCKIK